MAQNLRALAHDIAASHKAREAALTGIKKDKEAIMNRTAELLGGFKKIRQERRSEITKMKKEVAGMLGGFRKEMAAFSKEMERNASAWREVLSKLHIKEAATQKRVKKTRKAAH